MNLLSICLIYCHGPIIVKLIIRMCTEKIDAASGDKSEHSRRTQVNDEIVSNDTVIQKACTLPVSEFVDGGKYFLFFLYDIITLI